MKDLIDSIKPMIFAILFLFVSITLIWFFFVKNTGTTAFGDYYSFIGFFK